MLGALKKGVQDINSVVFVPIGKYREKNLTASLDAL